jgi:hypothetical protein
MRAGLAAATTLLAACACAGAGSTSTALPERALVRGNPGDTVRVIINHVLADKREQFEHFAHDVLMPAMVKVAPSDPVTARQMRQARLLHPVAMDRDSTYAYVFIVDPVATSGSYSFPNLFARAYGSDRANEYMQRFRESLARAQETYLVVNDRW